MSFFSILAVWASNFNDERRQSLEYLEGVISSENPHSGLLALGIISFGSVLAFIFNVAVYYYIHYTSALTSTIGSNGIKIFLICSASRAGSPLTTVTPFPTTMRARRDAPHPAVSAITDGMGGWTTVAGIFVVVVGTLGYAYFSWVDDRAPQPPRANIADHARAEPVASAASEATPLTQPQKQ